MKNFFIVVCRVFIFQKHEMDIEQIILLNKINSTIEKKCKID